MHPADTPANPSAAHDRGSLDAAFRELHGTRLHGFALLVLLGDRHAAARVTVTALDAGALRISELRHPERAAAWLRRHALDAARRVRWPAGDPGAQRRTLERLGSDTAAHAGLASLSTRERAALVAHAVERLDRRDVGTIVRADGASLDRLLDRARRRYTAAYTAAGGDHPATEGPIMEIVRATAARVIA